MKFIDICAGIGGFRSGLEQAGHECIGYVEIDSHARRSYEKMHHTSGEWTGTDITKICPDDVPESDLWCFGFPCQDISVAGKQKGLEGSRSGIFYSIVELVKGKSAEDRPEWLLIENVKNLLSLNGGRDFTEVLSKLSEAGYDCEWHVVNSKDYGVPQNRERVFIVGHLRDGSGRQVFPLAGASGQVGSERQERRKISKVLESTQHQSVIDSEGISPTLAACDYKDPTKVTVPKIKSVNHPNHNGHYIQKSDGLSRTVLSRDYKDPQMVAVPCLTPDRLNKRQNGRRFKEDGDPMFTLTAQDIHGVLIYKGEEYHIRRLTPRECFRLQGFTDEQFSKAQVVNSNSQLYKQAGNAVTVNVAKLLGEILKEAEHD